MVELQEMTDGLISENEQLKVRAWQHMHWIKNDSKKTLALSETIPLVRI